jgi:hypothetical protein
MEYSRRFRNEEKGSLALQPRNEQSNRAQNLAPNETTGNAIGPRQGLVFAFFALFALVKDSLGLGHIWLKMLSKNLQKNFLVSFPGMQLHQRHSNSVNVGTVDYDAWSNRFFHEHYHSHCPSVLKALYTKIIINKTKV